MSLKCANGIWTRRWTGRENHEEHELGGGWREIVHYDIITIYHKRRLWIHDSGVVYIIHIYSGGDGGNTLN